MRLVVLFALACACAPEVDGTAFKCDAAHGCPSDQMCISERCRRQAPVDIECGDETCGPTEQCCAGVIEGARCIGAGDVCPDDAALCDGINDCAGNERCCGDGATTACALACDSDNVVCTTDDDCPTDAPHCCEQVIVPWRGCDSIGC